MTSADCSFDESCANECLFSGILVREPALDICLPKIDIECHGCHKENCRTFSGAQSQNIVKSIRHAAHSYGQITLFKAYTDSLISIKPTMRSDLQLSGVTLVDCPHNGKKEVADRMMTGKSFVCCF